MINKLLLVPVFCGLLVTGLSAQDTNQGSDLASLLPENALGIVYVSSISQAESKIRAVVAAAYEEAAEYVDVAGLFAMAFGEELPVDGSKPCAIAVCPPVDEFADPTAVLVLPFKDAVKVGETIASMGFDQDPVVRGSYVAFAPEGEFTAGTKPSPLMNGLPAADVIFRVDLALIVKTWGEEIAMGLEMGAEEAAMGAGDDPAVVAFIEPFFQWTRDLIDSASLMDVTLGIEGTNVDVGFALTVKQGSPLAKSTFMVPGNLSSIAGMLPSHHAVSLLMSFDMARLMDMLMPMYKNMVEEWPESMREPFLNSIKASRELVKDLGSEFGVSMGATSQGLEFVEVFKAEDPVAYLEETLRLMKDVGDAFGVTFKASDTPNSRDVVMSFDWDKLSAFTGQEMPPPEMFEGMMESLFGEKEIKAKMAAQGKHLVMTMGGGGELLPGALASGEKVAKGSFAKTLSKAGEAPFFVAHMDLRRVVQQVKILAERMGFGDEMPEVGAGPPAPIGVYAGRSGLVYRSGVTVEVAGVAEIVQQMMW